MNWCTPQKPAEITETRLIEAILDEHFPINSTLPGERDLAVQLGITRPTLRESLQRLARDGWLEIQQGKPTRVRNYWQEGNLGVLASIAKHLDHLPADFVPNLLFVRQVLAPVYTRLAIENNANCIMSFLKSFIDLSDDAEAYALADWEIQRQMTICSGNPIFTLILNGFQELYPAMGKIYFQSSVARAGSRQFYQDLLSCAQTHDSARAEAVTQKVMEDSLQIWCSLTEG